MRKLYTGILLVTSLLRTASADAAAFTPGNLVVVRVGSGTGTLVNTGAPVFLDEFTPAGTLVQSIALPTTVSGSNKRLALSGTATSEGLISRSQDGQFISLAGYDITPPYASSVSGTSAATVNRTVAIVDYNGNVDLTTALTDFADANNPRGAVTNGTDIWVTGGAGGIRYASKGGTTSTQLSTAVTNVRDIKIFNNQLYMSTGSGSAYRIAAVGSGLPTISGQTLTALPGISLSGSPYQFFFADLSAVEAGPDVLYIVYDDVNAISKYSLVSGTWTANGTIGTSSDAYRGLTGIVNGSTVTLYTVRKGGAAAAGGGEFVSLTDASGYNATITGTPTLLATASTNTAFRGITLAPVNPLPLQLLSFNGVKENNIINLWWSTSDEKNILSFAVEESYDGKSFHQKGVVEAKNKAVLNNYNFSLSASNQAQLYYRVRINELNGTVEYSNIIKISNGNSISFDIYPNPAQDQLTIRTIGGDKGSIQIVDLAGKIVQQIISESNVTVIDIHSLTPGQYTVKYLSGDNIHTAQFIKH